MSNPQRCGQPTRGGYGKASSRPCRCFKLCRHHPEPTGVDAERLDELMLAAGRLRGGAVLWDGRTAKVRWGG